MNWRKRNRKTRYMTKKQFADHIFCEMVDWWIDSDLSSKGFSDPKMQRIYGLLQEIKYEGTSEVPITGHWEPVI